MTRMQVRRSLVMALVAVTILAPFALEAQAARGASRGVARGVTRSVARSWSQLWRREAARDAATITRPLAGPRTVYRYTTAQRARRDLAAGLAPGTHMTSRGGAGRPLSPDAAMRRLGLPTRPEVRETIVLPSGTLVRQNKVWRGQRGIGELTSPERLPPSVIRRVVQLPL